MDQPGRGIQGNVFLIMGIDIMDNGYDFRLDAFAVQSILGACVLQKLTQQYQQLQDDGAKQLSARKPLLLWQASAFLKCSSTSAACSSDKCSTQESSL